MAKIRTKRQLQFSEVIRRLIANEINEYVDVNLNDDFLTIMKAEISPDFRYCKVFYRCKSCNKDRYKSILQNASNELSNVIYKRLKTRVKPELMFIFDCVVLEIERINNILKKAEDKNLK